MNQADMVNAVNILADDVVDTSTVVTWLNMGKNAMARAANARFPDLDPNSVNSTFVFDSEWHDCAVLYAVAKYKEMDTAVQEVGNFFTEFQTLCNQFAERYNVPPIYRNDDYSQQFGTVPTNPDGTPLFQSVTALFPNANSGYFAVGPTYQDDPNFGAGAPPQTYAITKDTYVPIKSQLAVYVNSQRVPNTYITDNGDGSFTISPVYTVKNSDQITAIWNPAEDDIQPPYSWWVAD